LIVFGQTVALKVRFGENGAKRNPLAFNDVQVKDPAGNIKATLTPVQTALGEYAVAYTIPALGPAGVWLHVWDYQAKIGMAFHSFHYPFTVDGGAPLPHSSVVIGPHSEEIR
jgi:hypothetical protein